MMDVRNARGWRTNLWFQFRSSCMRSIDIKRSFAVDTETIISCVGNRIWSLCSWFLSFIVRRRNFLSFRFKISFFRTCMSSSRLSLTLEHRAILDAHHDEKELDSKNKDGIESEEQRFVREVERWVADLPGMVLRKMINAEES
jgi:hypothetical protein